MIDVQQGSNHPKPWVETQGYPMQWLGMSILLLTFFEASFAQDLNRSGRGDESFPTQGTRCLVHYPMLPFINRHPPPAETESGNGASKTVCSQAEPGNKETGDPEE
ncbi:hypothetical protein RISK_005144 [Rhodopirellula islandica]|uniref:Transmembrane protein n=1 Tax=Rhodopirellula islandica TaxID=595434 RepID=A0A0J1B8G4_RHOIS|nr:hypothetical protein RISK_005144 [Rhodopirellula islandica]